MKIYQFFKLQLLKSLRSISLSRNVVSAVLVAIFGFLLFVMILSIGAGLSTLLKNITGRFNVIPVLNSLIIFFFLLEMMYRFFLQKLSVIELHNFLHLPIGRARIVLFLLIRAFISPYNAVVIILFGPFAVMEVANKYSVAAAFFWWVNIALMSWSVHWIIMWYRQKYQNSFTSFLILIGIFFTVGGVFYYQWLDVRQWIEPVFAAPLTQPLYLLFPLLLFFSSFYLAYNFYCRHAYLELHEQRERWKITGSKWSFFDQFGEAGAYADLEMKLILRHKKSRGYLFVSLIFLAYGLIFYTNGSINFNNGVPSLALIIGILITGMFIIQYGQLYLSWNSPFFDFFMSRKDGIYQLLKGKFLLLMTVSFFCFILTLPYAYFGKDILLIHAACFIFNIGINIHIIVWMALWKPKPMNLNRSTLFNYEGTGLAQFLMGIPVMGVPYLIYLPVNYLAGSYAGLFALACAGSVGIILHQKIIAMQASYIHARRHPISTSFRQEL